MLYFIIFLWTAFFLGLVSFYSEYQYHTIISAKPGPHNIGVTDCLAKIEIRYPIWVFWMKIFELDDRAYSENGFNWYSEKSCNQLDIFQEVKLRRKAEHFILVEKGVFDFD